MDVFNQYRIWSEMTSDLYQYVLLKQKKNTKNKQIKKNTPKKTRILVCGKDCDQKY